MVTEDWLNPMVPVKFSVNAVPGTGLTTNRINRQRPGNGLADVICNVVP